MAIVRGARGNVGDTGWIADNGGVDAGLFPWITYLDFDTATCAPGAEYRSGTHQEAIYNSQIQSQVWASVPTPPAAPNPIATFASGAPQSVDLTLSAQIQPALIKGSASTAVKFAIGGPQNVDLNISGQVYGAAVSLKAFVANFVRAGPQNADFVQSLVFKSIIGPSAPLRTLSGFPQADTGIPAKVWGSAVTPPGMSAAMVPFVSAQPQYVDPPQPSVWSPSFWVITLNGSVLQLNTGTISVGAGQAAGRHRKWYAVKDGNRLLVFESKEAADAARAALKVPEARRRVIKVKAPKPVEVIDLKVLRREAALNDRLSDYIAYEQNRQYRELIQMRHHLAKDEEDIARALLKLMSYDEITEEEIAIVLAKL